MITPLGQLAGFAGNRLARGAAGGFQIGGGGLPADAGLLLDSPQRPSQAPEGYDLVFVLFFQDIAHEDGRYPPVPVNVLAAGLQLAGFQVITTGRF